MKKLLVLLCLSSSLASANQLIVLEPGTYRDVDYVRVYCYDWNQKTPRDTKKKVHLEADGFRRCAFTTVTYRNHGITRVFPQSSLPSTPTEPRQRIDLEEMERQRKEPSAWEKFHDKQRKGFKVRVPILTIPF